MRDRAHRLIVHLRQQRMGALALFLVLTGGVAYAADTIGSSDVIDNSLLSADLKNNLAVRSADVTNESLTGSDIDESTLQVPARAYARVRPNACTGTPGTCTPTQSKGISSVTRVDVGLYCVTAPGINSNVTPAAVTVEWSDTFDPEGNSSAMTDEDFNCGPSGQGFGVVTERQPEILVNAGSGSDNADASGPAAVANLVGFTIVIP